MAAISGPALDHGKDALVAMLGIEDAEASRAEATIAIEEEAALRFGITASVVGTMRSAAPPAAGRTSRLDWANHLRDCRDRVRRRMRQRR